MRRGKLNKREMETILRAQEIINAWIDYQEGNGEGPDDNLAVNHACTAVVGMVEFISEYRNEM